MLLLPSGQVLHTDGAGRMSLYTADEDEQAPALWRPLIVGHPSVVRRRHTYTLYGRRLNGLSQAVSAADGSAVPTNYPLVRLEGHGHVVYCRTFDHSVMGVATGEALVHTNFAVPDSVNPGWYRLRAVANGISSASVEVLVSPYSAAGPLTSCNRACWVRKLVCGGCELPVRAEA
jgi:hypothetical protein